jgi:serine/threonine protein kinase
MSSALVVGDYVFEERLGQGGFGTVWLARHTPTHLAVAIKVISKARAREEADRARVFREADFLRSIHHPNIIAFYDFLEDASNYYLVLEVAENGTLLETISASRTIGELMAKKYLRQLLSALRYLHTTCHIVHRDLKCENVLLDRGFNIRLIDFELSRSSESILQSTCGTLSYIAPEMMSGSEYTDSVDIWSTGVILYAIVAGSLPYHEQTVELILKEILYSDPVQTLTISGELADLLSKMLQRDPASRITLDQISAHPWVAGDDTPPLDEFMVQKRTIEKLSQLGIAETPDIQETPSFRIVYRWIETESKMGLPALVKQQLPLHSRATGTLPLKPMVVRGLPAGTGAPEGRTGRLAQSRASDVIASKPSPSPPRRMIQFAGRRKWKTVQ